MLIAWGCPYCLTIRVVEDEPAECCGVPVTASSAALLVSLESVVEVTARGLLVGVSFPHWLRGAWEPEAERLVLDELEKWKAEAVAALQ